MGTNSTVPARGTDTRTFAPTTNLSTACNEVLFDFVESTAVERRGSSCRAVASAAQRSLSRPPGVSPCLMPSVVTRSRSSSSISPSLNDRMILPTPSVPRSGGAPKRMTNSSVSWASTVSLPMTETTILAEIQRIVAQHRKVIVGKATLLLLLGGMEHLARRQFLIHLRENLHLVLDSVLLQIVRPGLPAYFHMRVVAVGVCHRVQDEHGRFVVVFFRQSRPLGDLPRPRAPMDDLNGLYLLGGTLDS